jgi:hypothetical protein
MFWITTSKKSMSTTELMRRLKMNRFETVSNLLKKIRLLMGNHNDTLMAGDTCEADESFVVTSGSNEGGKTGRGTQKTIVHILASYVQTEKGGKNLGRALKNVKMDLIDNASAKSIKQVWDMYLTKSSKVTTDSFRSYSKLKEDYPGVTLEVASGKDAHKKLPWVHILASNYKKINLGIFHNTLLPINLQYHLDEFCFKTNLRKKMDTWMDVLLKNAVGCLWNAML